MHVHVGMTQTSEPIRPSEPILLADPVAMHPTRRQPATVLIADDDVALRHLYRRHLEAAGYDVVEAGNGASAVAASQVCRVDAVLLDLMMPDVDGWGVLAAIRDDVRLAEASIVLMSAHAAWLDELAELGVGADGYYEKGPRAGGVVDVVDEALARRFGMLQALRDGATLWGPLSDVGVQALIAGACDARVCGVLTVDDSSTTWCVWFDGGCIASASALSGSATQEDAVALASLLEVADAPFAFEPLDESTPMRRTLCAPWSSIGRAVVDGLNAARARSRAHVLGLARPITIDRRRFQAWAAHIGSTAMEIARALVDGVTPRELLVFEYEAPLAVDALVQDLVRRRVVEP